ncbi:MAG: hypothetical protein LQ346_007091, partial [Caloplaca aetnensis]
PTAKAAVHQERHAQHARHRQSETQPAAPAVQRRAAPPEFRDELRDGEEAGGEEGAEVGGEGEVVAALGGVLEPVAGAGAEGVFRVRAAEGVRDGEVGGVGEDEEGEGEGEEEDCFFFGRGG